MFHRKPTKDARSNVVSNTNTTVPQRPSPMHPTLPTPKPAYTSNPTSHTARAKTKSPAPSAVSQTSISAQKPSSLPRPTSRFSEQRLDALASSRSYALTNPSAHFPRPSRSGSENVPLIFDDKVNQPYAPPEVGRFEAPLVGGRQGLSTLDMEDDTVLGLALPTRQASSKHRPPPPELIPELQALATHYQRPTNHPPPSVSTISSPSTRLTESPAPWSASTATTTPVSWPSTSPAVAQASKLPDRKSKTVPQPTVPRSRLPKLPTLQHSVSLSKPSAPPVPSKDGQPPTEKRAKRKPIVESPAPTPPPRKSSTHRADGRGDKSTASSIDETLSRAGSSTAPPLSAYDASPLASRTRQRVDRVGDSLKGIPPTDFHTDLQRSISSAPSRPSRDGTEGLVRSRAAADEQRSGFNNQHIERLAPAFDENNLAKRPTKNVPRDSSESSLVNSGNIERSPSKLGRLARLGIFTRRGNTPSSDVEQSPKKLQRRGPAAGTGHEGYRKHSRRSRKTSTESSGVPSDSERSVSSVKRTPVLGAGRKSSVSSSQHNRSSQSDLDDFAASRMKPFFMRGGSQSSIPQPTIIRSDRRQANTPEQASSRTSSASPGIRARQTPTELPRLRSPRGHIGRNDEQTWTTSEHVPTLAQRRSQRFGTDADNFRIPQPLFTNDLVAPTQITSHDTTMSSVVPSSAAPSSSGAELYRIDPSLLRPSEKKSKRAWWNPFKKRNQSTTAPEFYASAGNQNPPEMAVSIPTGPAPRTIPYYAVMESESDNNVEEQIGEFLSEAVQSSSPKSQLHYHRSMKKTESMLLPTAPVWSHPPPPPPATEELQPATDAANKQTRLAQVGRIPKVVSRSERQHVPSRRSFSQPFSNKANLEEYPPSPRLFDHATERPHLEIQTDVLPSRPFPEAINVSAKPASAPAAAPYYHIPSAGPRPAQQINIASHHGSSASASSSSDGMLSVMGPPLLPTKEERSLTGRMPKVRIPSMQQGDDEIWKEYDDFIDHVMSPSKSPKLGPRLILDQPEPQSTLSTRNENLPSRPRSRGIMPIPEPRRAMLDLPLPSTFPGPIRVPSPLMLPGKDAAEEIRLRRSRIISALHSSIDTSSPFSMREFLMDYGEQSRDSFATSDRLSGAAPGQPATITPTSAAFTEPSRPTEHSHREHALLLDTVARSKDPVRESELHYASLEVSRWLSFGRVLFSPAHEELHMLRDRNVLVIDGLGSEDWSMYCAEFYQTERATVYDLQETIGSRVPPPTSLSGPSNHRRAEIVSFSDRFPFPSAFFSAIVLRFPPALSEAKMRNIVTECRRILVPGGHLEIMLLDLDIVNMGVQTRRAVKELKITMATSDPEVSLRPGIDNFQNILGGRGFTGLNRCVIGVPVVGRPSGSMDSSSSSHSSRRSSGLGRRASGDLAHIRHSRNRNFSLSELVADHSEKADAQIGRMVSSCARSWWTHVYEAAVIPDGDLSRSIFADKRVLQECKSRASSFKLLIAYAQRPVFESRRRTMSEPGAAVLATTGSQRRARAPIE